MLSELSGTYTAMAAESFDPATADMLLNSLEEYGHNLHILEHASGCCSALSRKNGAGDLLGQARVLEGVLVCAQRHLETDIASPLVVAVSAVADMIQGSDANRRLAEEHGALTLCRHLLFKFTSDAEALTAVFFLLEKLSIEDTFRDRVREEALLPAIVGALAQHASSYAELALAGCRLIARLAQSDENRIQFLILNVLPIIIDVLEVHKDKSDTILYACWAIVELAVSNDPEVTKEEEKAAVERLVFGGEEKGSKDDEHADQDEDIAPEGRRTSRRATVRLSVAELTGFEDALVYEVDGEIELTEHESSFEEVIVAILKNMRKHKNNADVHRYGTLALENLATRSEKLRVAIAVRNGVQTIISGMNAHFESTHVLANGCHALAVLASDDEKMHRHIAMMRGIQTTISAMKKHLKEEKVQSNACRLLANVSLTSDIRAEVLRQQGLEASLTAFDKHRTSFDVLYYGFRCIESLSTEASVRQTLQENGKMLSTCLDGLKAHLNDVDLQISGIRLLERLAYTVNDQVMPSTASIEAILLAMQTHKKQEEVISESITALNSLALNGHNRQSIIASRGHDVILTLLPKWKRRPDIVKYACGTLSNLAFKSDKIRQALLVSGVATVMCSIIKDHLEDAQVLLAACATLRNLSSHISSHRKAVSDAGAFEAVKLILDHHRENGQLVYWALGIVNNICREAAIKREAVRLGWVDVCADVLASLSDETSTAYQAAMELWNRLPKPRKHNVHGLSLHAPQDSVKEMDGAEMVQLS
eukprot:m.131075 g.131075  ORF g.131075 m.131075 type:complete len:766 (-) comp15740_c1_seq1:455-2752(-)